MARKEDLQAKADSLGLDTSGTIPELEARIEEAEATRGHSADQDPTDPETHESTVVTEGGEQAREDLDAAAEAAREAAAEREGDDDTPPGGGPVLTSTRGEDEADANPLGVPTVRETGYIGTDPIYQNAASEARTPRLAEGGPEREAEEAFIESQETLQAQSAAVGVLGYRGSALSLEQTLQRRKEESQTRADNPTGA